MARVTNRRMKRATAMDAEFDRASNLLDRGKVKEALRIFLGLARSCYVSAQLNAGYLFDRGIGCRRNRTTALTWYRRAYANGSAAAAHNIGTMFRDDGDARRAVAWFTKAHSLGEVGSLLEIAKIYLRSGSQLDKARSHLKKVAAADDVTQADAEEAGRLLKVHFSDQ
jgi:TPR repeat protein